LSQLWIKICGITESKDAEYAVGLNVDAIGLVFYSKSPRAVSANFLPRILGDLAGVVSVVALFVDPSKDEVNEVLDSGLVDLIQFHGNESEEFCSSFDKPYMKAIHIRDETLPSMTMEKYSSAKYLLLDTYSEKAPGGTGEIFDWSIASDIMAKTDQQIVLAGGLTPSNVEHAVRSVRPFGVDVSSGVELSPGKKDMAKLRTFVQGARRGGS
tara:strand:- start:1250 stop:1885 length:636 start_codon:yes stop_codon:yes gene_type:complete